MSSVLFLLFLYLNLTYLAALKWKHKNDDCNGVGCFPQKSTIPHAILLDSCKKIYTIDTAVSVTPTSSFLIPIQPCLSCDMKLQTTRRNQTVTVIIDTLGIQSPTAGQCQRIRLDIFDGWTPSDGTLLSNKNGICGSDLPHQSFQTSNNTLTIRLKTSCSPRSRQFGTFDIIVAATEKAAEACPGQFQCGTGQCLDKNKVCDGFSQCPDQSDESGCHGNHRHHGVPSWLVVIFIIIAAALFVLFLVTMAVVCLKYVCDNGYTRV